MIVIHRPRGGISSDASLVRWSVATPCRTIQRSSYDIWTQIAGVAGTAVVLDGAWLRPRLMRWGASDEEEIAGSHPGAGLVLQREIGDDGCHDQRALVGVPLGRSHLA